MWMKLFLVIALAIGSYLFFGKSKDSTSFADGDSNTIIHKKGQDKVAYRKQRSIEESYMIFGLNPEWDDVFSDAYFTGIPINTARTLLQKYPDIGRCGSQGSTEAKNATSMLHVVGYTKDAQRTLKEASMRHEELVRTQGQRFCLRIYGNELKFKEAFHGDEPVNVDVSSDARFIHIERAMIEGC